MADFFDKMLVSINKGVSTVSEGSKSFMEKAKLNAAVSDGEKEVRRLFEQLGQEAFALFKAEAPLSESMTAICTEIHTKQEMIKEMREKLAAMEAAKEAAREGIAFCPSCGAQVKRDSKFCGKCGAQLK